MLVLPISLAAPGASLAGQKSSPPTDLPCFNVRQFGAKGDGQTRDTRAIQAAMDAAAPSGGRVFLPPGRYLSGTVRFHSHITLHLDAGATLVLSSDATDFDSYEKLDFKAPDDRETTDFHHALLRGQDLEHVGVIGPGIIEGNRQHRGGPKPLAFKNCRHVAIHELTIQNSPNYNISLLGCEHVDISGVTVLNGHADGIDPDCCRFVRIANCFIESWDDCIVPKASFALGRRGASEHLTITNCILTTASNCFKLGTESCGDFKNITFSNCAMFASPGLWHHAPRSGICLNNVDGGSLEQIAVSNVVMSDVAAPLFLRLGNRGRAQKVPAPGSLAGISISDICARGATLASSISGLPGKPVKEIMLSNVRISSRGGGAVELSDKKVRELPSAYPTPEMFGELPAYGLFCRHADSLTLANVNLQLERPDGRPALILEDVTNLQIRGGSAAAPEATQPTIWLRNVRGCFLQGFCAPTGMNACIKLTGEHTSDVRAVANDFSAAAHAFEVGSEVPPAALRQQANLTR